MPITVDMLLSYHLSVLSSMGVLSFFVKYPVFPFHISLLCEGLYEARKAYENTVRVREKKISEYELCRILLSKLWPLQQRDHTKIHSIAQTLSIALGQFYTIL
jgi:hypothetical protein